MIQILPRSNYQFDSEKMSYFFKSLMSPIKKKGFFKSLFITYPYEWIIDCDDKGLISFYFKTIGDETILLNSIQSLVGDEADVFLRSDELLDEHTRFSTLYLKKEQEKKDESKTIARYMSDSLFMTLLSSMPENTRVTVKFKVLGASTSSKGSFMRQLSDVNIEYELLVSAKTKYDNAKLNTFSHSISSLTAQGTKYYVDYKETFKVSISSGYEMMNLIQIPTLKGRDKEIDKIYHLLPGQITINENEFSYGIKVGQLDHPVQKNRDVFVSFDVWRDHVFISGTTGSGKTSAMEEAARDLILKKIKGETKIGFTLFDPKESAALGIIDILLKFQSDGYDINPILEKLVYVDLNNENYVFPIALLNRNVDSNEVLDFFKSLYGDMNTVQVDRMMGDGIESLLSDPTEEHTIFDMTKIFDANSNDYRDALARRLESDIYLKDNVNFLRLKKLNMTDVNPILNRLNVFKNTKQKRLMFGLTSTYDCAQKIRTWMDEGYIVLMNLAGKSQFDIKVICGYLSLHYYLTMLKRPRLALLHLLFVDEAHDVQLPIFHKIAAKGREKGLALVPMTQYAEQFSPDYREQLFGNLNTFISLKQSSDAAYSLAKKIPGNKVQAKDLTILSSRRGYLTTRDNGVTKSVLIQAEIPYRYTDGKVVAYDDAEAMQQNEIKNRNFAWEIMKKSCLSRDEAEKIVFKEHYESADADQYEKELLEAGDSIEVVNSIWEE